MINEYHLFYSANIRILATKLHLHCLCFTRYLLVQPGLHIVQAWLHQLQIPLTKTSCFAMGWSCFQLEIACIKHKSGGTFPPSNFFSFGWNKPAKNKQKIRSSQLELRMGLRLTKKKFHAEFYIYRLYVSACCLILTGTALLSVKNNL